MESEYKDSLFKVFLNVLFIVVVMAPIVVALGAIGFKKLSIYYLPVVIILGVGSILLMRLTLGGQQIRYRKDVIKGNMVPYQKFTYEQDEWKEYISGLLDEKRKGAHRSALILGILTVILFSTSGLWDNGSNFGYVLAALSLSLTVLFLAYLYTAHINPLKSALDDPMREIDLYTNGIIIRCNSYMIRNFGINNANVLLHRQTETIGDQKYICFTDRLINGEEFETITKTSIPLPRSEYDAH